MDVNLLVFYVWFTVSVVVALAGFWVEHWRVGRWGFLTLAAGLSLLALTINIVHPAVLRTGLARNEGDLQDLLMLEKTRLSRAQADESQARLALVAKEREFSSEQALRERTEVVAKTLEGKAIELQQKLVSETAKNDDLLRRLDQTSKELRISQDKGKQLQRDLDNSVQRSISIKYVRESLKKQLSDAHDISKNKSQQLQTAEAALVNLRDKTEVAVRKIAFDLSQVNAKVVGFGGNLGDIAKIESLEDTSTALQQLLSRITNIREFGSVLPPSVVQQWLNTFPAADLFRVGPSTLRVATADGNGTLYSILLTSPAEPSGIQFEGGRFFLSSSQEARLDAAFAALNSELSKRGANQRACRLLIRGLANRKPLNPSTQPFKQTDQRYLEAVYLLPKDSSKTTYGSGEDRLNPAGPTYENKHLPNLRAAYIHSVLTQQGQVCRLSLLDGQVKDTSSPLDQSFELYLAFYAPRP